MNRKLVWLAAALPLIVSAAAQAAAPDFAATAERIRQAEERAPGIPMDRTLYADQVTYGHNIGPAHTSPASDLLAHIGPEQAAFDHFVSGRKVQLIRFVAGGDTAVAEIDMTGALPDRTRFDTKTAIFFTIAHGRIARMELWADPILGKKFAGYMAKDPGVMAARAAK